MNYKPNSSLMEFEPAQRIDREVNKAMKDPAYVKIHTMAIKNYNR